MGELIGILFDAYHSGGWNLKIILLVPCLSKTQNPSVPGVMLEELKIPSNYGFIDEDEV